MHGRNINLSVAAAVILSLTYSLFMAISVRSKAEEIAAGSAFCVQTAGSSRYREAHSLLSVLPVAMHGHGGLHHAVLVVGDRRDPRLFHWSYRKHAFVQGVYGPLPIYCTPSEEYFGRPLAKGSEDVNAFTLEGISLSIPDEYRSEPDWPGDAMGFHFFAVAPDFLPASQAFSNGVHTHIEVSFSRQSRLDVWRTKDRADRSVLPMEEKFGLKRQLVRREGSKDSTYEFYSESTDGRVKTIISCFESMKAQCLHSFERDGWTYTLHQAPSDIEHWERIQENVVKLVQSFRQP
jgi:hypothetical protein